MVVILIMCIGGLGISVLLDNDLSLPSNNKPYKNPPNYLQNIPSKPDDFTSVLKGLRNETDICILSNEYYLQPDFYSKTWRLGERHYEEHDYSRWLVYGYGAYPGYPKAVFTSNEVDREIQLCTLYHTEYGIETWQGIKLVPETSEYFEVTIEPNEFLLPPTFPNFDKEWVKKINIIIRIKQIPYIGNYNIIVNTISPSKEKTDKWKSEVLEQNNPIERMLEECIKQNEEKKLNLICEELIQNRRNKYVENSNINIGERLVIKIIVK